MYITLLLVPRTCLCRVSREKRKKENISNHGLLTKMWIGVGGVKQLKNPTSPTTTEHPKTPMNGPYE